MASMLFVKEMADLQSQSIRAITDHASGEDILAPAESALFRQLEGRVLLLHFAGAMSFGAANAMTRRMAVAVDFRVLVIDLQDVPSLDVSAALALESIVQRAQSQGQAVVLAGIHKPVARILVQVGLNRTLRDFDHYRTRQRALERATELVAGS
jgi:SulP family sulfate permease